MVLGTPDDYPRTHLWQAWLRRSVVDTLVARKESELVGFISLQPENGSDGTVGDIAAVFVHPTYWRQGIGRLFFEHAFNEAETRGYQEIALWVLESNERARLFYESLGFELDGAKRIFFEDPEDPLHEIRYRIRLAPHSPHTGGRTPCRS